MLFIESKWKKKERERVLTAAHFIMCCSIQITSVSQVIFCRNNKNATNVCIRMNKVALGFYSCFWLTYNDMLHFITSLKILSFDFQGKMRSKHKLLLMMLSLMVIKTCKQNMWIHNWFWLLPTCCTRSFCLLDKFISTILLMHPAKRTLDKYLNMHGLGVK